MKKSELKQMITEEVEKLNEANPAFARKQYNAIAKILKNSKSVDDVRNKMADMFEADNPNFNKEKFISASK